MSGHTNLNISSLIKLKDNLIHIFKFCHNYDLQNIELTSKKLKERVSDYFKFMINRNNNIDIQFKSEFELKKHYIKSYINEIKIMNINKISFDSNFSKESINIYPLNERSGYTYKSKNYLFEYEEKNHLNLNNQYNQYLNEIVYINNMIMRIIFNDDYVFLLIKGNILKIIEMTIISIDNSSFPKDDYCVELQVEDEEEEINEIYFCSEFKMLIYQSNKGKFYLINMNKVNKENKSYRNHDLNPIYFIDYEMNILPVCRVFFIKGFLIGYSSTKNEFYMCLCENILSLISYNIDISNIKTDENEGNFQFSSMKEITRQIVEEAKSNKEKNESDADNINTNNYITVDQFNFTSSKHVGYIRVRAISSLYKNSIPNNHDYNIIKFSESRNGVMFIDSNNGLYYISSNDLMNLYSSFISNINVNEDSQKLVPRHLQFDNINIDYKTTMITSGDNHWLLLISEEREELIKWSTEQVMEWFNDIDLSDYVNIIKYEKITGRDIIEAEKDFYIKMMGMFDMDHYQKVKYEMSQIRNKSYIKQKLYGWGNNLNGQLSLDSAYFYRKPVKLDLPQSIFSDGDYISDIYAGKSISLILTKYGKVYSVGNSTLVKEKEKEEDKIKKEKKESKSKKGKEAKETSKEKENEGNKWCLISINTQYEEYFKIKNIRISEFNILFIGENSSFIPYWRQEKKAKYNKLTNKQSEKFISADEVISKLQKNTGIENYYVVYENPKYGLLENSVEDFVISEVPYHKILQIKYFREIIWDRKKRFMK